MQHIKKRRSHVFLKRLGMKCFFAAAFALLIAFSDAQAGMQTSGAAGQQPIRIISTPNPAVLPLLLAISREPELPIRLLPVRNGAGIDQAFASEQGEALLSMTRVAASKVISGTVPDLALVSVNFWRGFFELITATAVSPGKRLSSLSSKNLLLSGPVDGGRGGGPDTLFKAMMKREGFDPSSYTENTVNIDVGGTTLPVMRRVYASGDFRVYYLPVMSAAKLLHSQIPLDDGDGYSANDQPAGASFMVEPAASGIVMEGFMHGVRLRKAIDVQQGFSGYASWPKGQLPLGGLSLRASLLHDPGRAWQIERLRKAYEKAASDLMAAKGHPLKMAMLATAISKGVDIYYGQYGLSLPAPVIAAAIRKGDLIYRNDLKPDDILTDLQSFEVELLGGPAPVSFYRSR